LHGVRICRLAILTQLKGISGAAREHRAETLWRGLTVTRTWSQQHVLPGRANQAFVISPNHKARVAGKEKHSGGRCSIYQTAGLEGGGQESSVARCSSSRRPPSPRVVWIPASITAPCAPAQLRLTRAAVVSVLRPYTGRPDYSDWRPQDARPVDAAASAAAFSAAAFRRCLLGRVRLRRCLRPSRAAAISVPSRAAL